jgi:hypothetical protein
MRVFLIFLPVLAFGQATTPVGSPAAITSPLPVLPTTLAGAGLSWQRGASYPLQEQTIYAKDFATTLNNQKVPTPWYLYVTASTPITPTPTGGTPVASTLSGGACYVAAQSPSVTILLLLCATGGLTATQANAGGAFNGNLAGAFKIGKTNWWAVVGIGGSSLVGGAQSGTFIAQPYAGLLYGWGVK